VPTRRSAFLAALPPELDDLVDGSSSLRGEPFITASTIFADMVPLSAP
jgi:hypothetical protein